jgi:hypothetical protein
MTQEQLLSVLAACQGGCDPDNIRQVDVLGEIFSVSDEGSLGIDVFRQVAELDTAMRVVMSSLPVDEAVIGDAMLALGAIAAGPVRLGAEVLKSTLVGDYIDDASRAAKDYVSTAMAGAAHNADRESMAHVAGAEPGLYEALFDLTESLEGPVSSYSEEDRALYDSLNQSIALAEGFGDTLHGAQIVTDYVYAVMMGDGGGVAKSSRGDHKTGGDQRDHAARELDSESEARVTKGLPKPGSLSNEATRKWYHQQLDAIPSQIDSSLPLREQALQAFKLRNDVKLQARDLMADRATAASLPAPKTLQDVVRKAYDQGLRGDDVWRYVLGGSQRSNTGVDAALGFSR